MIAITGTPGTGKSSVGHELALRGHTVLELHDFAQSHGLLGKMDRRRGAREVDVPALRDALVKGGLAPDTILISHLAHEMDVSLVVVLRCRPSVLRKRLEDRGYLPAKVRENVEAEALDVILVEAVETGAEVAEVDATTMPVIMVADAVEEILAGEREKYAVGHIDWSEEVLDWF